MDLVVNLKVWFVNMSIKIIQVKNKKIDSLNYLFGISPDQKNKKEVLKQLELQLTNLLKMHYYF